MTKLSLVLDQEMRCWMLPSSSMLSHGLVTGAWNVPEPTNVLVELMNERSLYHFGLLGGSSSPNGRIRWIARVPRFGAIGVYGQPIRVWTAVDRHAAGRRGRRGSELHLASVLG